MGGSYHSNKFHFFSITKVHIVDYRPGKQPRNSCTRSTTSLSSMILPIRSAWPGSIHRARQTCRPSFQLVHASQLVRCRIADTAGLYQARAAMTLRSIWAMDISETPTQLSTYRNCNKLCDERNKKNTRLKGNYYLHQVCVCVLFHKTWQNQHDHTITARFYVILLFAQLK